MTCLDFSVVMDVLLEILMTRQFLDFGFKFHQLLLVINVVRLGELEVEHQNKKVKKEFFLKSCWGENILRSLQASTFNISFSVVSS